MIKFNNVEKTFQIPHERRDTIKENLFSIFRSVKSENFYALQDISFEIKDGSWYGIVGSNGSGKSTLLKVLAGIYEPNAGEVIVDKSMVPFLELGVGFNPELSARDNIFLNGILLGMSEKKVRERFDQIVEFAEIGQFLDTKLKNYSSGMQVRLAFSIAIQIDAEIYLLDEVLAVGDISFQNKCKKIFKELKKRNKTVLLVSHDLASIDQWCEKAIWIEKGKLRMNNDAKKVTNAYWKWMLGEEKR